MSYREGDRIVYIGDTNHETGLRFAEIYELIGVGLASDNDDRLLYALKDSRGNVFYSYDKFIKVNSVEFVNLIEDYVKPIEYDVVEKKETGFDDVSKPEHYTSGEIEAIDIIQFMTEDLKGIEAFTFGNVLKYIIRCNKKGGWKDIEKAKQYFTKFRTGKW